MSDIVVNYIGYLASAFVAFGFVLKDVKKIRIVNMIGCICFVVYGFLNETTLWPVVITNMIIILIQIYHLINHKK